MKQFSISFSIFALASCFYIPNAAVGAETAKYLHISQAKAATPMDCDCRAQGQIWRQGEQVCLNGHLRICGMEQNVTTWQPTGKTCPTAQTLKTTRKSL